MGSRGKDTGRRGDTSSVTSCSGPYHGLNSVGRRYQEQSKMPSQGGSVLLYTRNPSPSPMVPGKLKLIILNFQYFESPRQKRKYLLSGEEEESGKFIRRWWDVVRQI